LSSTQKDYSARLWYALDVEIEATAREAVEYALMEAGALGTETNDVADKLVRVTAYFDHTPNRESVRAYVADALRLYDLPSSSIRDINFREVADEDWLGEWKKSWQPVEVGQRFIVAPPWAEISDDHARIVIRIEPGMAFGTGTHETTRLCLAAIEKYFQPPHAGCPRGDPGAGGSFLDVGTGTGILAIAAAKFFPGARVEACDTDADALAIAQENARLNDVADKIAFRVGSVEEATASADLVCANLTADVIAAMLPSLGSVTCGRLILSGILDTQLERITVSLRDAGFPNAIEIMQDGEWIALVI
jgi:ribosomal protein L11 methyltransferase